MKPRADWSLYLVADPHACLGRPLEEVVRLAVAGGTTVVQLRDKECTTRRYVEQGRALHELLAPLGVPLIVNDRIDVALAVGAEGAHVGQSDMPPDIVRRLMGSDALVGLSAGTPAQVLAADGAVVDYVGVGPVFATATKPDAAAPWGVEGLRRLRGRRWWPSAGWTPPTRPASSGPGRTASPWSPPSARPTTRSGRPPNCAAPSRPRAGPRHNRRRGSPVPSAAETNRRYFREAYATGRHGWGVEEPDSLVLRQLRELAALVPGGTLLDVGCGEGRHALAAAALGFRVTGVDYEPGALRRARRFAREKGARGVVFRRADVFALPFAAATFDVVLDYGCLHHQRKRDWPAYRAAVRRVLKPGGCYVLCVFSPRFPMFRGGARHWHIARGAYRRCFTRGDIEGLFARDFALESIEEDRKRGFWHVLMRAGRGY